MSLKTRSKQQNNFKLTEQVSSEDLAIIYDLKMPEVKLTRLESNALKQKSTETIQKRSRSKPKDNDAEEKKPKSRTERRSRSTSKSRSSSRKRTELKGAKLYTKKDLEQVIQPKQETVLAFSIEATVKPAKRSLRSSSSTSTTKLSTIKYETDSKQLDDSLLKEKEALLNDIDSISIIGQNLDTSMEQQPRYSLRKRGSPTSSDKQSINNDDSKDVQEKLVSISSPVPQTNDSPADVVQTAQDIKCQLFSCGYLRYSRKQIIHLVIISILMVTALTVLNYLNENSLSDLFRSFISLRDQFIHFTTDIMANIRTKIGF